MYGTAWRMLQNREEAEDAVQDAFLALHRAGPDPREIGEDATAADATPAGGLAKRPL